MKLEDKVAIVTGAAQGQGRSHSLALAEEGADIAIIDLGDPKTKKLGQKVKEEVESLGKHAVHIIADITQWEEIKLMTKKVMDSYGKIDILVNNAGIMGAMRPITGIDINTWKRVLDVNLTGTFLCCKAVVPYMIKQKYGKIINITSGAGKAGQPNNCDYCVSKAGIISLTESLATELAKYNLNVNAICPGYIYTPMVESVIKRIYPGQDPKKSYEEVIKRQHLFKREITLRDISNAVVWLASEDSRNVTGHTLDVNAGQLFLTYNPYFEIE